MKRTKRRHTDRLFSRLDDSCKDLRGVGVGKARKGREGGKKRHSDRVRLVPLPKLLKCRWYFFSLWVKIAQDWTCITCGFRDAGHTDTMQASHLFHGNYYDNNKFIVNCQCNSCHYLMGVKSGAGDKMHSLYEEKARMKWGSEAIDKARNETHCIARWNRSDVEAEILTYYAIVASSSFYLERPIDRKFEKVVKNILSKKP